MFIPVHVCAICVCVNFRKRQNGIILTCTRMKEYKLCYICVCVCVCLFFPAVIEHVRDACTLRAIVVPSYDVLTVAMTGIKVIII